MKKLNKLIMTTALMAMTALPVSADIQMMLVDRGVQQDTFSNGERDYTESVFHYMVEIAAVNEDVYFHDFYWDTVPSKIPLHNKPTKYVASTGSERQPNGDFLIQEDRIATFVFAVDASTEYDTYLAVGIESYSWSTIPNAQKEDRVITHVPDDNPIVSRTVFSQGYSAIPEPNTVVVFLFGAAILYLRQKFIC
jgi:hypothetical protein